MNYKALLLALLLGAVALVPCFYMFYYNEASLPALQLTPVQKDSEPVIADVEFESEKEKTLDVGVEFDLKSCKVVDGYRFQLSLEGGKQITAHLTTATKDEATTVVVDLLNKAKSPRPTVVLRRKSGENWIVDFYISIDGNRTNLIDDLKAKGLLP